MTFYFLLNFYAFYFISGWRIKAFGEVGSMKIGFLTIFSLLICFYKLFGIDAILFGVD